MQSPLLHVHPRHDRSYGIIAYSITVHQHIKSAVLANHNKSLIASFRSLSYVLLGTFGLFLRKYRGQYYTDLSAQLPSWYCLFCVRDGEKTVGSVMDSLLRQTYLPSKIVAVNDGSSDETGKILNKYGNNYEDLIEVISTDSKTRDYTRIPRLWNMALREGYDFHMVAAGDVRFCEDYAEKILNFIKDNPLVVVCSGSDAITKYRAPRGAGRFVSQQFFFDNYKNGYPAVVGYESEIVWRARMKGYRAAVVENATFEHLDKLGHSHQFYEWGQSMKALGYTRRYVISRFWNELVNGNSVERRGAINMLWAYLSYRPQKDGYFSGFPQDIKDYARKIQNSNSRISRVKKALSHRTSVRGS
jgi:glycosyltransferase involved in cell wall biosynthesis